MSTTTHVPTIVARIAELMGPTRSPSKLVRYCAYTTRQFSSSTPELSKIMTEALTSSDTLQNGHFKHICSIIESGFLDYRYSTWYNLQQPYNYYYNINSNQDMFNIIWAQWFTSRNRVRYVLKGSRAFKTHIKIYTLNRLRGPRTLFSFSEAEEMGIYSSCDTLLQMFIDRQDIKKVIRCLFEGCNPNEKNRYGFDAFEYAERSGTLEIIECLAKYNSSIVRRTISALACLKELNMYDLSIGPDLFDFL
jgi:ankyrin repeat protein